MKKRYLILITLGMINFSHSENLSNIQAAFIDIGFGARPIGLGGAYTAVSDDALSPAWNPAGLARQEGKHSLAFSSVKLFDLISYNYLGYGLRLNPGISLGAMAVHSGDDLLSETSVYLTTAINWGAYKLPTFLKGISLGINLKYLASSYGNNEDGSLIWEGVEHQVSGSANGFGIDFGLNGRIGENTRLGIMFRNAVNSVSWNSSNEAGTAAGDYKEKLPAQFLFGYSRFNDRLLFALDYNKSLYDDVEDHIYSGLELALFSRHIFLRGGFSQEIATGENKIFAFGGGTRFQLFGGTNFALDLAYQVHKNWSSNNSYRISFNLMR